MTLSDFRRITDELLSAYIDDEVTEQERALVEAALAADPEIAWRLDSLRQTVTLLRDLPELALPRSFTLTLDQLRLPQAETQVTRETIGAGAIGAAELERAAMPAASPLHRPKVTHTPPAAAGFWEQLQEGWRRFWQGGNPMLRNAAAVSFALMLFIASSGQLINRALTPVGSMATAPQAAPAAAPAAESVALVPAATEPSSAEGDTAGKAPAAEGETQASATESSAPQANARILQSQAAPAEEAQAASEADTFDQSADQAAANEADAAIAEAAPASDSAEDAPVEEAEAAVAAAAMAPPVPFPGGGRPQGGGGVDVPPGMGGGAGGDGTPPGIEGGETGLVPPQAYSFEVNPVGEPTTLPAEEAVSASVAAAPAEAAPAESVADVVVTPAVDAPVEEAAPQVAMAAAASEPAATEVPADAVARSAATAEEVVPESATESTAANDTASDTASDAASATTSAPAATEATVAVATEQATEQAVAEVAVEPTATPEAVALVAPGEIASSDVVENVPTEGAVVVTGPAGNLPVVWVAQGTMVLLTVMLTSLWWRSRTPRRPRQ